MNAFVGVDLIEAVVMDMSPAYHQAVTANLPASAIVSDRFHVRHRIARAHASDVPMLHAFAKTLHSHRGGLLAYYDYLISNGPHISETIRFLSSARRVMITSCPEVRVRGSSRA